MLPKYYNGNNPEEEWLTDPKINLTCLGGAANQDKIKIIPYEDSGKNNTLKTRYKSINVIASGFSLSKNP